MSNHQLSELTKAVHAIGSRLDSIDGRLDSMDSKFDAIDDKFGAIDNKFIAIDKRFDTMEQRFDSQFTRLFKYSQKEFAKVHKRLDQTATKDQFNSYVNAVDAFAKQTEIYHQEMEGLSHKVDRHETWHHQTAKTVGIKLTA